MAWTHEQNDRHIDAHEGGDQNHDVGQHLDDAVSAGFHGTGAVAAQNGVQDHGDDGGGQSHEEVHAELVLHLGAAALGGGNGGVGDHGQVVAEVGAADDRGAHDGGVQTGALGHTDGHGSHGGDGAHGGADGGGDEAAHQKYAGDQQGHGDEVQSQVDDGRFAAHGGSGALEAAGHQIDQNDHHNAGVAHVLAEHVQLVADLDLGGQQQRHGDAGQQSHVTGELTEGTLNTHQSERDAAAHIQGQEYDQGKKCGCA